MPAVHAVLALPAVPAVHAVLALPAVPAVHDLWNLSSEYDMCLVMLEHTVLMQVPVRIFVTKQLPKTATGKIQRRMMVEHFIKGPGQKEEAGKEGSGGSGKTPPRSKL